MMNISTDGILALQKFEGLSLSPYKDEGGKWTIGYGHLIKPGEDYLMKGITDMQAHQLFVNDLVPFVSRVNKYITRPLNQRQFDALVIWDFNTGKIHNTELAKLINEGASGDKIYSFWTTKYITASGKPSRGLEKRRAYEAQMFFNTTAVPSILPSEKGNFLLTVAVVLAVGFLLTQKS